MWNLITSAGRLDIVFKPAGTKGYDDIKTAALRDIVRSKKAAGRPQDRQDVAVMVEMLRKRPAPRGGKT
jgi:hypothetical protein